MAAKSLAHRCMHTPTCRNSYVLQGQNTQLEHNCDNVALQLSDLIIRSASHSCKSTGHGILLRIVALTCEYLAPEYTYNSKGQGIDISATSCTCSYGYSMCTNDLTRVRTLATGCQQVDVLPYHTGTAPTPTHAWCCRHDLPHSAAHMCTATRMLEYLPALMISGRRLNTVVCK